MPANAKPRPNLKLAGVELYFDDLSGAQRFYGDILGLTLTGASRGHHAQFNAGHAFVCLEKKGVENYPSRDKAVLFFEVSNLSATIAKVGHKRVVAADFTGTKVRQPWAVLHDPEGHNIPLLESRPIRRTSKK